jgi:hypothetical protein
MRHFRKARGHASTSESQLGRKVYEVERSSTTSGGCSHDGARRAASGILLLPVIISIARWTDLERCRSCTLATTRAGLDVQAVNLGVQAFDLAILVANAMRQGGELRTEKTSSSNKSQCHMHATAVSKCHSPCAARALS